MGFYATTEADPRPKNRVVGSPRSSAACAWSYGSEAVELRQEIGSMGTTTVSGVLYWLSNDPIGIAGGLNQYAFCGNNPVNFRDPLGLQGFMMPCSGCGANDFTSVHTSIPNSFNNPIDAALWAAFSINRSALQDDVEYGGFVVVNPNGTYSFTSPVRGVTTTFTLPGLPANAVAWWHHHGGHTPGYSDDCFSDNSAHGGDIQVTLMFHNMPNSILTSAYLFTPSGVLLRVDYPFLHSPIQVFP